MKKIIALTLALVMLACCGLALSSCQPEEEELIIGITYFAPMNYKDGDGNLIGFETEFAKAVCEKLGVEAKFQEISWAAKETELAAKNIDCIWNGMTITEEREENMSISIPYMQNKQVKIVKSK